MPRQIRHIMPFGPRVLVRVFKEDELAESGLYLPPGAKEKTQEALFGEVIEVARAEPESREDGFGVNVAGVPNGAKVLFAKAAGTRVPWDDDLRILDTKEILATVDVVSEDELS
jgi:co-chaperonin GroES (HSP10)